MKFKRDSNNDLRTAIQNTAKGIGQKLNAPAAIPAIRRALSQSVDLGYNGHADCVGRANLAGYLVEAEWWSEKITVARLLTK